MPLYEFVCVNHGEIVEHRPFSDASLPCHCAQCGEQAERVYGNFVFVEDRCRFARNPRTGSNFSDTLGTQYPQDRRERDAIYKQKGIEPVTPSDLPSQWKTALDYSKHLKSGGEKLDRKAEAELIDKPDLSDVKSIAQMVRESGMKVGA
jgi:putative FmdB family regulatory protein